MSLKAFHIIFIIAGILSMLILGAWGFYNYSNSSGLNYLGLTGLCIVGAVGLIIYEYFFLKSHA